MWDGKKLIVVCLLLIVVVNLWLTFHYIPKQTEDTSRVTREGGFEEVDALFQAVKLSHYKEVPKDGGTSSPAESKETQQTSESLSSKATPSSEAASSSENTKASTVSTSAPPTPSSSSGVTWKKPEPGAMAQGLPLCNSCYDYNPKLVTMYFDQFARMNNYFGTFASDEKEVPETCNLPDGAKCRPQHTDSKADVVFKSIQAYSSPIRHCYPQIVAILNSEAVVSSTMNLADIRIDHHLSSGALYNEACGIPAEMLATREPPDPKARQGTGLFLSNCGVSWRSNFIKGVMDHTYVHSYGRCFHNQKEPSDRGMYLGTYSKHASKHRTVITFENTIQADYISEKIMLVYESGAIPVYWGPPEIYLWVPGNHSFIDASKFKDPKALADYLKRIDEEDDLFRYHTTNLDTEKTLRMKRKYCENKICRTCRVAYEMKKKRYENGCK
jgi:hypothetical protein